MINCAEMTRGIVVSARIPADVSRMTRPSAGERIRVVQQKTGAPLTITVHPELRRSFESCPSGHLAAIVTAYGTPFSIKGFGQFISDAIRAAGLPQYCKAHGLRKAAASIRLMDIARASYGIRSFAAIFRV
jgi:hypothetical protein